MDQGFTVGRLNRAYTLVLLGHGGLLILLWVLSRLREPILLAATKIRLPLEGDVSLAFGALSILVALLRLFRGARAWPASIVWSLYLAVEPPLGTALFLYWLLWVRPREPRPLFYRPGRVTRYTIGTIAVGFAVLIVVLMIALPLVEEGRDGGIPFQAKLHGALSLLAIAVGMIRCVNYRWGSYASLGLSILLLPVFPHGTAVSLYWLMQVRREENEAASNLATYTAAAEFE